MWVVTLTSLPEKGDEHPPPGSHPTFRPTPDAPLCSLCKAELWEPQHRDLGVCGACAKTAGPTREDPEDHYQEAPS